MTYEFSIIVETEPLVTIKKCEMCDLSIESKNGNLRRYCTDACRTRHYRRRMGIMGRPLSKPKARKGWYPTAKDLELWEEYKAGIKAIREE
jgi:hypothetical protein